MKNLGAVIADEQGVSPVIGVILMVAVTVIVAAVIGASALGMSDSVSETPPRVSFDVSQETKTYSNYLNQELEGKTVIISHEGGESFSDETVDITVNGENAYGYDNERDYSSKNDAGVATIWEETRLATNDNAKTVTAGETVSVMAATDEYDFENEHNKDIVYREKYDVRIYERSSSDYLAEDVFLEKGDIVRIVWQEPGSDQSTELLEYEVE